MPTIGDQREQAAIRPFADLGDQRRAPVAHGDERMRTEEDDEAEDFDGEAHKTTQRYKQSGV